MLCKLLNQVPTYHLHIFEKSTVAKHSSTLRAKKLCSNKRMKGYF